MQNSIPYVFLFLLLFIFTFEVNTVNYTGMRTNYNNERLIIIFFTLLIFWGLRGFISTDWVYYYSFYNDLDTSRSLNSAANLNWEKGFVLLNYIAKGVNCNYFVFQFCNTLFDILVLVSFFFKNQPKRVILCFLFYFLFAGGGIEINLLRNSKAIMLFLLSLDYIGKRKIAKYILINLLGCFFHISALIYILILPYFYIKISQSFIKIFFLIGIVIYCFQIQLFSGIVSLILKHTYSGRIADLVWRYITNASSKGLSIGGIERIVTMLVFMRCQKKVLLKYPHMEIYYRLFYIYFFLNFYCSEIIIIPARLGILFVCSYWILYPAIYSVLNINKKKLFLFFLFIYGMLLVTTTYSHIINKYTFCFNEVDSYKTKSILVNEALHKK